MYYTDRKLLYIEVITGIACIIDVDFFIIKSASGKCKKLLFNQELYPL